MGILTGVIIFILLFLFPLGQAARIDIGNGIAINPLDVGVCILALILLVTVIVKRRIPFYVLPLGIFVLLGLIGLLLNRTLSSNNFFVSLLYLFRFVGFAMVGVGVSFLSEKHKKWVWYAMLLSGGLLLASGFVQYFLYPSLRNLLYAGWDPHLYRLFGTFLDPNFAGAFFATYSILMLDKWYEEKGRKKVLYGILGLLAGLGVLLTFSRGAYVDLGIALIVYIFLRGYKKLAIAVPIVVIVLGFIFAFFVPTGEGKHLLRTASTQARLQSAENALIIFSKNPLFGVGFNSYRYAQHKYNLLSGFNWEDTHSGAGANNSYVFVLATTGIFGGIAYGWFWYAVMKKSVGLVKKKQKHSILFFTSFIALLVSGMFENTLFYPSIMLWLFVLLGLTD